MSPTHPPRLRALVQRDSALEPALVATPYEVRAQLFADLVTLVLDQAPAVEIDRYLRETGALMVVPGTPREERARLGRDYRRVSALDDFRCALEEIEDRS